jgi:polysaccharide pyruvyl transferase WcaK-like protein
MARHNKTILLLGSYGRGNIGDDAFLLAALQLFEGYKLYINSANDDLLPQGVRGRVNTIATSGGKDLMRKLRIFRSIQYIVYCGGDLWVELYGDRFPRQSLYKMAAVNLLARLTGKKVFYLGCGIGRLHGYSLFLARLSARLANGIIVREPRSAQVLGLKKIQVLPDLVTTLDVLPGLSAPSLPAVRSPESIEGTPPNRASLNTEGAGTLAGRDGAERPTRRKYTIGVSILYHLPNPDKNFPKLVKHLSKALSALSVRHYRIVLFPMLASPNELHDDVWASAELQKAMPDADVSIFGGREITGYVAALQQVDLLIGTRLHASIIALLAGVPALGIAYRPKVAQFFASSGLERYCIDLDDVTPKRLEERIAFIRRNQADAQRDFLAARQLLTSEGEGYSRFVADRF